jgi:predicted transcriptional regulator
MTRVKSAVLSTGGSADFFKRSRRRAAKLDRGEKLPDEIRLTFEDPAELLRVLSKERVRVLQVVRVGHGKSTTTVSGLAAKVKRDRKSVSRDVTLLESLELLRTREQANPGHGTVRVVEPLAGSIVSARHCKDRRR